MPPPIRQLIQRDLANGDLTATAPLTATRGIGPYLERRLRDALGRNGALSVGDFWTAMRRKTTLQATELLHLALQNKRANQCVSPRRREGARVDDYHVGDINEHGYEAAVTLLDHARTRLTPRPRYGALPHRLTGRSTAGRTCACRARCDGPCTLVDGLCVPRAHNARGFDAAPPHPEQGATVRSPRDRARARRQARALEQGRYPGDIPRDADSRADAAAGARRLRYVTHGHRMWRRPGSKVRSPRRR